MWLYAVLTLSLYGHEWSATRLDTALPTLKSLFHPLNMRLGDPQKWNGRFGEYKSLRLLHVKYYDQIKAFRWS
jgi:hypothetical protein